MDHELEIATLGGGCFWCLEAVFQQVDGVRAVESGYTGGHIHNPTYRQVCEGDTGHAEVVRVTFDPARITFREILEIFFTIHDPTQLNRQGSDVGEQVGEARAGRRPVVQRRVGGRWTCAGTDSIGDVDVVLDALDVARAVDASLQCLHPALALAPDAPREAVERQLPVDGVDVLGVQVHLVHVTRRADRSVDRVEQIGRAHV